jgi:phage protein D
VIGGDDKKPITVTVSDSSSMKKYGLMQHVERNFDDKMTKAKLQSLAKSLLKQMNKVQTDITIEAAGITSAIAGAAIDVKNKLTGLSSTYYISSDTHTFTPGVYTMTLQVSKDDILPTMDYEE